MVVASPLSSGETNKKYVLWRRKHGKLCFCASKYQIVGKFLWMKKCNTCRLPEIGRGDIKENKTDWSHTHAMAIHFSPEENWFTQKYIVCVYFSPFFNIFDSLMRSTFSSCSSPFFLLFYLAHSYNIYIKFFEI